MGHVRTAGLVPITKPTIRVPARQVHMEPTVKVTVHVLLVQRVMIVVLVVVQESVHVTSIRTVSVIRVSI